MDVIVERPAALDVHKAQVTACVRLPGEGRERRSEVREFSTIGWWRASTAICW
jgi:transposase